MANPSKIALFGGSFDPVHLGHIEMATRAHEALALDQVRFLPCQISPHKLESQPTPAADRLEMLRLATRHLPWAVIDDHETKQPGPSYSWQTAATMRDQFPNARLFWIMGTDQWQVLHTWHHPERLADCIEFIVMTRGHQPNPVDGFTLHPVEFNHPASSTEIRDAMAAGQTHHPWLQPEIAEWINSRSLYSAAP